VIYETDADDYFLLSTQDYADSGCGFPGGGLNCLDPGRTTPALSWPNLLVPYIKTLTIFVDPGTGDPSGDFAWSGPNSNVWNWNNDAQYGYNYEFLSPMIPDSSNGDKAVGHIRAISRSSSQGVHPANTVMFATAQGYASSTSAAYQFLTPDADWANPPGAYQYCLPAPDRVVIVDDGCYSGTTPNWTCGWVYNTPVGFGGPVTADVRVLSPYGGGILSFVDGHAKFMAPGAIAAGTDYGSAQNTISDGPTPYGATGAEINNVNAYLWTLDGTLDDIK